MVEATAAPVIAPRFVVGDRVRVRNQHPPGHVRTPHYCRGHTGITTSAGDPPGAASATNTSTKPGKNVSTP